METLSKYTTSLNKLTFSHIICTFVPEAHFIFLRLFKETHFELFVKKGYFFLVFDPTWFEISLAYFVIMFAPKICKET